MSKWVSVKDKLPELNKRVLIYGYEGCSTGCLVDSDSSFWSFDPWDFDALENCAHHITHWMNLPESPKYPKSGKL